jgi:hypothetical protein
MDVDSHNGFIKGGDIFRKNLKLAVCTNIYNNGKWAQDLIGEDNGKQNNIWQR